LKRSPDAVQRASGAPQIPGPRDLGPFSSFVTTGLDPVVHAAARHHGLPGHARQWRFNENKSSPTYWQLSLVSLHSARISPINRTRSGRHSRIAGRVRCPRADLQPAPGRHRASACRHYDRRARCYRWTGTGEGG